MPRRSLKVILGTTCLLQWNLYTSEKNRSGFVVSVDALQGNTEECFPPKELNQLTTNCYGVCGSNFPLCVNYAPRPKIGIRSGDIGYYTMGCAFAKMSSCKTRIGPYHCQLQCLEEQNLKQEEWTIYIEQPQTDKANAAMVRKISKLNLPPTLKNLSMVGKTESTRKVPIEFEENAFSSGEAVQNITLTHVLIKNITFNIFPSNLTTLVISDSKLSLFEPRTEAPFGSLRYLDLSDNELKEIPAVIFSMKNLTTLNLKGNPISNSHMTSTQMKFLKNLKKFDAILQVEEGGCRDMYKQETWDDKKTVCYTNDEMENDLIRSIDDDQQKQKKASNKNKKKNSKDNDKDDDSNYTLVFILGCMILFIVIAIIIGVFIFKTSNKRRRKREDLFDQPLDTQQKDRTTQANSIPTTRTMATTTNASSSMSYLPYSSNESPGVVESSKKSLFRGIFKKKSFTSSSVSNRLNELNIPFRDEQHYSLTPVGKGTFLELISDDIIVLSKVTNQAYVTLFLGEMNGNSVYINRLKVYESATENCELALSLFDTMAQLRHPLLMSVIGFFWEEMHILNIVCDDMNLGTLEDYLLASANKTTNGLTWKSFKMKAALDIAECLMYLHNQHQRTYDVLNSKTVLVDTQKGCMLNTLIASLPTNIKASYIKDESFDESVRAYIAPEVLAGEMPCGASDMYAFGVLLAQLDACETATNMIRNSWRMKSLNKKDLQSDTGSTNLPVDHTSSSSLMVSAAAASTSLHSMFTFSDSCPEVIKELAFVCLQYDPSMRPSASFVTATLRQNTPP